jgi:aldose sugar dehydrogenase
MPRLLPRLLAWCGVGCAFSGRIEAAEPRAPAAIVAELCANCHNQNLVGSPAPNLVDALSFHGNDEASVLRSIRQGFPASGMPAFEGVLSEEELRGLFRHIRELRAEYAAGRIKHPAQPASVKVASERHAFRLETFVADLETPWGIAFLPDGGMLVTEREGRLRVVANGKLEPAAIRGTPDIFVRQDGGLLDVIAHPEFARNGWLYLAYSEKGALPDTSMTVVVRGRIRDGAWVEQQEIFRAPPAYYYPGYIHYGCRFLFDREGHLYFTIGDRGRPEDAQDVTNPCGKIHRVFDDGRIPPDNPFAGRAGAWGSIWTLGNRHAQGLAFHPVTGKLWAAEHGPTGGDELNRIERGANYGWPIASNGTDRRLQFVTSSEGMESPLAHWSPSVAPSGIGFYTGRKFPRWKNQLFIACLGGEQLKRIETEGDRVVHQEIVFRGFGRVRSVLTGPDGLLYLAMNTPGRIARLVPEEE